MIGLVLIFVNSLNLVLLELTNHFPSVLFCLFVINHQVKMLLLLAFLLKIELIVLDFIHLLDMSNLCPFYFCFQLFLHNLVLSVLLLEI